MREEYLHYIWANRLFDTLTHKGECVEVLSVGEHNSFAGPDFSMARVRIGEIEWAGSIEIHKQASEWTQHNHHKDPLYDSVILHIVLEQDVECYDTQGNSVPTALLDVSDEVLRQLNTLLLSNKSLRCMPEMLQLGGTHILDRALELLPARIEEKLDLLKDRSESDHFNSIFYLTLMRYMGAHQNNEAMELVARSLPYNCLKKHASDSLALEAMLIGQAGLICKEPRDEYEDRLLNEYQFYRQKFSLTPIPSDSFKRLRLRPSSFPTRMLGIVAQILHHENELLSAITTFDKSLISSYLSIAPSPYWQTHMDFGRPLEKKLAGIGSQTLKSLIINAVIPTLYYYARQKGDKLLADEAIKWLYDLSPEQNQFVRIFERNNVKPRHAADSQALLQLYHKFCRPYKCLKCQLAIDYFAHMRP